MKERALELLRRAVGDPRAQFRPGQWEAIQALVEGRKRLLVVERTGWGKSVVYFIAARILRNRVAGAASSPRCSPSCATRLPPRNASGSARRPSTREHSGLAPGGRG